VETISGSSNWILTCRRETESVTILRAETCDETAALPDTLWNLPVRAIGHHAFTPGHRETEGERLRITCGPATEPDNHCLRELILPDTVVSVGDYAFYNCGALRMLSMGDIRDWGGSVFMNCRLLDTFHLRLAEESGRLLSFLADELAWELDVSMTYPDGGEIRLIFPEYRESYEENCPAHHFDYNIFGAGYPYHHCFRNRAFHPADFDGLWPDFLATEHDEDCALRLAWWRLRLPRGLDGEAEERYLRYLQGRGTDVLAWLLTERDVRGLSWFLDRAMPDRAALEGASQLARKQGAAEAQALLLEQLHRRFPAGADKTFDL